jgi:hypothetical protein
MRNANPFGKVKDQPNQFSMLFHILGYKSGYKKDNQMAKVAEIVETSSHTYPEVHLL